MKLLTRVLLLVAGLAVLLVSVLYVGVVADRSDPYPEITVDPDGVPRFRQVALPFVHRHDAENSLPFLGSAIIDVDGDGTEEVFLGGGYDQPDALFAFRGGAFVDISDGAGLDKSEQDTTLGAAVIDATRDGRSDLVVTRDSGVYLYTNAGGRFEGRRLDIEMNDMTTPLSPSVVDLDQDGDVDIFVSGYVRADKVEGQSIFNDVGYGGTSVMAQNDGSNRFRDITSESGLEYLHNTFQATFVDLDEDRAPDLVVAYDTGQVRTWRNLGDGRFENVLNPNSGQYSYPMGIAVGDYDNDTSIDFFFSNVGTSPPGFLVEGDLREDQVFNRDWILFRNAGGFEFEDRAEQAGVAGFEFGWGAVMEDFNLDGREDLVVAENYVGFPPHQLGRLPGRLLVQREDQRFAAAEDVAGIANPFFGITPLVADFNDDGYPDLLWVNLNGPTRAFLNEGGDRSYLKIRFNDQPRSLGAIARVTTDLGQTYVRHLVANEGLCSDQSHVLLFGLDDARAVDRVEVSFLDGEKRIIEAPPINTTLRID